METECDVLLNIYGWGPLMTIYMNNDGLSWTVVKRRSEALTATTMNDNLILQTDSKEGSEALTTTYEN